MNTPLIGHRDTYNILSKLHLKNKLPHGVILSGEKGTGKKKLALAIARLILIGDEHENTSGIACLPTPNADFHLVEPPEGKKVIPIESIRELQSKLSLKSFNGKGAFVVIDDAHKMSNSAANCLLKTLEEPEGTTYIFLITDCPQLLPDTIRSRCHSYTCSALSPDEIAQILAQLTQGTLESSLLDSLGRLAQGSLRILGLNPFINENLSVKEAEEVGYTGVIIDQNGLHKHLSELSTKITHVKERIRNALGFEDEEVLLSQLVQLISLLEKSEHSPFLWEMLIYEVRERMLTDRQNGHLWAGRLARLTYKKRECESRNLSMSLQVPEAFL